MYISEQLQADRDVTVGAIGACTYAKVDGVWGDRPDEGSIWVRIECGRITLSMRMTNKQASQIVGGVVALIERVDTETLVSLEHSIRVALYERDLEVNKQRWTIAEDGQCLYNGIPATPPRETCDPNAAPEG